MATGNFEEWFAGQKLAEPEKHRETFEELWDRLWMSGMDSDDISFLLDRFILAIYRDAFGD